MMPDHFIEETPKAGRPALYEVRHLQIGESAYFPGANVRNVGNSVRHRKPMHFCIKTVMKGGIAQVKVTRLK